MDDKKKKLIAKMYTEDGFNMKTIAEKVGVSEMKVSKILRDEIPHEKFLEIKRLNYSESHVKTESAYPINKILDLYKNGMKISQISKVLCICNNTVKNIINGYYKNTFKIIACKRIINDIDTNYIFRNSSNPNIIMDKLSKLYMSYIRKYNRLIKLGANENITDEFMNVLKATLNSEDSIFKYICNIKDENGEFAFTLSEISIILGCKYEDVARTKNRLNLR